MTGGDSLARGSGVGAGWGSGASSNRPLRYPAEQARAQVCAVDRGERARGRPAPFAAVPAPAILGPRCLDQQERSGVRRTLRTPRREARRMMTFDPGPRWVRLDDAER
jgi:hypothetical protein